MQGRPALGRVMWSQVPAHPSTNIAPYSILASRVSLIRPAHIDVDYELPTTTKATLRYVHGSVNEQSFPGP